MIERDRSLLAVAIENQDRRFVEAGAVERRCCVTQVVLIEAKWRDGIANESSLAQREDQPFLHAPRVQVEKALEPGKHRRAHRGTARRRCAGRSRERARVRRLPRKERAIDSGMRSQLTLASQPNAMRIDISRERVSPREDTRPSPGREQAARLLHPREALLLGKRHQSPVAQQAGRRVEKVRGAEYTEHVQWKNLVMIV